ncbi:MAG: hypothetical protein HYT13_00640 [Candidatus Liptonbacteria bacterium]|nr:hypothetical protein [Candidatus Liptonbacteria bacterium]
MAVKLRSISRSIPWFLIFKAAIFGAAWLFLPFWLFLLIAFYLYFFPPFQIFRLVLPFLLTTLSAAVFERGLVRGAFLSLTLYLILGIKDLIFIKRVLAYKLMTVALIFLVTSGFFHRFSSWGSLSVTFWSLVMTAILFLLSKNLYNYEEFSSPRTLKAGSSKKLLALGILGLLGLELAFLLLFLPFSFYYQMAFFGAFTLVILALTLDYLRGFLFPKKIIVGLSFLFVFLVFILASTEWGI